MEAIAIEKGEKIVVFAKSAKKEEESTKSVDLFKVKIPKKPAMAWGEAV